MTLEDIKQENVAWEKALAYAFNQLDENSWPASETFRKYAIKFNNKLYPNKQVLRYATEYLNKNKISYNPIPTLSGGKPINDFLESKGAEAYMNKDEDIFDTLIDKYKRGIVETELKDEIYKWNLIGKYEGLPDLSSPNFFKQLKDVDYSNLIYGVTNGVISNLSEAAPDEYLKCFELLFDNAQPIQTRIQEFHDTVLSIYRGIGVKNLSHHHDERTMSTLLAFKYPDRYPLFKYTFYEKFCYYLNEKPAKRLHYYSDYIIKLNTFISSYIRQDSELIELVKGFIPATGYTDPNFLLLAQDILYQTLDKGLGEERKYWRIGTTDADISYWTNMKNNGFVSIGWPDIGNLDEQEVGDPNAMKILLREKYYKKKNEATSLGKKAKEINNFYHTIKVGDVVLAQDGQKILGIGIIEGVYSYDDTKAFPHLRKVKWYSGEPKFKNTVGLRTTVSQLSSPSLIDQIDEYIEQHSEADISENNMNPSLSTSKLNQILYGPPGTGKTYTTIEKAIAIANPAFNLKQDRAAVKAEYKRLCDVKQIEFITFHQSLSYEDFVEGIKPDIEEDMDGIRSVVYKINDGLFKTIVNRARVIPIDEVNQKFYHFDDAWNALVEMVQKSIENQQDFVLDILTLKKGLKVTEITNNGNLRLTPKSSPGLEYTVSYSRLKELHKAVPSLSQVKNIDKEFRAVIGGMNSTTYWATLNFVNNWLEQSNKTKTNKLPSANVLPHVLIIDEINRGNVSQIFGELITLLEEDKREGEPEALQVTLPYSKERFSVPKNLYIIGTMNTADRSVEALDTALRRRFAFEEMLPNPYHEKIENVEDISLRNVLAVINTRLEKLLSRDHTIGHSFFIGVTTEKRLYSAFYDKIIPLLQEYFFGDYGKIGLVLGKAFVEEVSSEKDFSFADFEYEEQDLLLEKRVYRINRFDKGGDDFLGAVKAIYIKGNPS